MSVPVWTKTSTNRQQVKTNCNQSVVLLILYIYLFLLPMEKYAVSKLIGEGSFGRVYKATNISTKETVALKVIGKVSFESLRHLLLMFSAKILNYISAWSIVQRNKKSARRMGNTNAFTTPQYHTNARLIRNGQWNCHLHWVRSQRSAQTVSEGRFHWRNTCQKIVIRLGVSFILLAFSSNSTQRLEASGRVLIASFKMKTTDYWIKEYPAGQRW